MSITQRLAVLAAAIVLSQGILFAQAVAVTGSQRIAVAHDGVIELFTPERRPIWKSGGVAYAEAIAVGTTRLAVVDPLDGVIRIVALAGGASSSLATGDTPIDALFVGDDLFVVERDGRKVERFAANGTRTSLQTGVYPEILRSANGMLYVYSRADGLLLELSPEPFEIRRSATVHPWASDFEVDTKFAYFVDPAGARLRLFDLASFKPAGERRTGGVPVDLAIVSGETPLTSRSLAVADPSSKTVWFIDAPQSAAEAFGRGFLRGLLGIAGSESKPEFRAGVDRVVARGSDVLAFDSRNGALFAVSNGKAVPLGRGIGPHAFAFTADGVVIWNGTLVAQKLGR